MLKKLIAYQRLLLTSAHSIDIRSQNPLKKLLSVYGMILVVFMTMYIFMGHVIFTNGSMAIVLSLISIWKVNRIFNGSQRLFETVPVGRKYIVLNIFLLSIVIIIIGYLIFWSAFLALIWLLLGVLSLVNPQSITYPPDPAVIQIINSTKGNILVFCIFLIIIFAGITIIFIKSKKLRFLSFAGFASIGYGLLFFLRFSMPLSPNTSNVEFAESFSIMPQANSILICAAIATVIVCITSVVMVNKLYITKSNKT